MTLLQSCCRGARYSIAWQRRAVSAMKLTPTTAFSHLEQRPRWGWRWEHWTTVTFYHCLCHSWWSGLVCCEAKPLLAQRQTTQSFLLPLYNLHSSNTRGTLARPRTTASPLVISRTPQMGGLWAGFWFASSTLLLILSMGLISLILLDLQLVEVVGALVQASSAHHSSPSPLYTYSRSLDERLMQWFYAT